MYSIVIPVYNEYENIERLIDEIKTVIKNKFEYEIIIIDDCSEDDSLILLNNLKSKLAIKILSNNRNQGQSFSIHKGVNEAKFNNIITLDGDGQNDPKDIPKLVEIYNISKDIFLVGGLRKKRKDKIIKIVSSKLANYVRSRILKDNCSDTGCSLKIFDKKIFLSFPFFDGMHRFIPALFKGFGYNTKFIEVNHRNRLYGKSNYDTFSRLIKGIKDLNKVRKIIKNNQK